MTTPDDQTPTWTDAYRALAHHRLKATAAFVLVVAAAFTYLVFADKVYRSEAKLLVRLGRENSTLDPTATPGMDTVVAVPATREEELNSVVEVLRSRAILDKVVDSLGADTILERTGGPNPSAEPQAAPTGWWSQTKAGLQRAAASAGEFLGKTLNGTEMTDRDRAIKRMERSLGAQTAKKSNLIEIVYETKSPRLSQSILTSLTSHFLDEHLRIHHAQGARDFFAEQVAKHRQELAQCENELRDLKTSTGLTSPEDQRKLLVERVAAIENDLMAAQTARAVATTKVSQWRDRLDRLPATEVVSKLEGVGNYAAETMRGQLYLLEMEAQEYAAKYTDAHPKMIGMKRKLLEARQTLAPEAPTRTQVTTSPGRLHQEAELALLHEEPQLASFDAQTQTLHQQIADARQALALFNANELRIAKLEREIELNERNYLKYAANLEEARIGQALEGSRISNISVVQPASLDGRPVRPVNSLTLALGLFGGLFAALAVALLAERLDGSFHNPQELEAALSLPTLASIPRFERVPAVPPGRN